MLMKLQEKLINQIQNLQQLQTLNNIEKPEKVSDSKLLIDFFKSLVLESRASIIKLILENIYSIENGEQRNLAYDLQIEEIMDAIKPAIQTLTHKIRAGVEN